MEPSMRERIRGVPVITISREYGAQGAAVGRIVAERLGFRFWDREMIGEHQDAASLIKLANDMGEEGGAVMIGRGLSFLFAPSRALRVRVVCPLEHRIAGLVERQGLTPDTARATIAYADRARRLFVNEVYCRDIDDIAGYDLWVSTGEMSRDAAAAVIISTYRYRFGGTVMRSVRGTRPPDDAHP